MTSTTKTVGGAFLTQTPDTIFVPEDFKGDDALMIRMAEQFSRKEVLTIQEALDSQEEGLTPRLVRQAGDLGFCGIDAPTEFGGLGLSKNLAARMLEFLSLNASFSVTIGITSGISQVGLVYFGNDSQRAKYLPKLTSGEQIGAYALSEPNSGSDALSMTTRADLQGDRFVLNGTKMWISNAKWADQFLVMAKVGGEKVTAFLVERDFPGVSIAREEHKMGLKGSSTARLVLENAEIPVENMIYEEGKGHHVAFNSLNLGRFKLSSMSMGPAREAIKVSSQYAQDRRQFGQPLSNFGLIQSKFAHMAAWFYIAESVTYRTGALIDDAFADSTGDIAGNMAAAAEYAIECSASKILATELESLIVDEALQIYGGYGFTEEFPVARIYRDARISRIYEGTNEINRIFLADRLARKYAAGLPALEANTPIARLAHAAYSEALGQVPGDRWSKEMPQVRLGALSELAMYAYAEQSVQARAHQTSAPSSLTGTAQNWLMAKAISSYWAATGHGVDAFQLVPYYVDLAEVAALVLSGKLPLTH